MTVARRATWAGALVVGLVVAAGCGAPPEARARDRALAYFAREVREVDHGWTSIFDYLHRRFGLEATLADGRSLHGVFEAPRGEGAVYRRLVDPGAGASLRQIAELPTPIDRITATALHCDRIPLPADWVGILRKATHAGAYTLTHGVLATRWTLENGCLPESALLGLHVEQVDRLVAMVEDPAALVERHALALDIWIEALAMLHYAGAGDRVRAEWIALLLEAQRPDGGWPNHPRAERSHPHPTALALWVLLETLEADAPAVSWIPGP